jgi:hypothetical protein
VRATDGRRSDVDEDLSWIIDMVEDDEFVEVLAHDHPVYAWYLVLNDEVASLLDSWVDELVLSLAGSPRVQAVVREDSEVLLLNSDASAGELSRFVNEWWSARLHR